MNPAAAPHNASIYSTYDQINPQDQFLAPQYMAQQHLQPLPMQRHHHHHLPNQASHEGQSQRNQVVEAESSHHATSFVGVEGMPEPASRPNVPKLKFSAQEDQMLVNLKETKSLTWKQIADFFPGRTSGTLQVRYCTKLKAKTVIWADDSVQRLRKAMLEYQNDKWRLIAAKVGNGFSPTACQEKAEELEAQEELEDASTCSESEPPSEPGIPMSMPSYSAAS